MQFFIIFAFVTAELKYLSKILAFDHVRFILWTVSGKKKLKWFGVRSSSYYLCVKLPIVLAWLPSDSVFYNHQSWALILLCHRPTLLQGSCAWLEFKASLETAVNFKTLKKSICTGLYL